MSRRSLPQQGFTLLEIMAAMLIISILSIGLISGIMNFMGAYQKTSANMQTMQIAQGLVENFRRLPDSYASLVGSNFAFEGGLASPIPKGGDTPEEALRDLMPGMNPENDTKTLSARTSLHMRDLAFKYKGLLIADTSWFINANGPRQPRPPDWFSNTSTYDGLFVTPAAPPYTATPPRVRPTLQSVSLEARVIDRKWLSGSSTLKAVEAPTLARLATTLVRNPKQVMDRSGSEAFRIVTGGSSEQWEPIPYSEANANGLLTAGSYTYDFVNKKASVSGNPADSAFYQFFLSAPPRVLVDYVAIDVADQNNSTLTRQGYFNRHAIGLTVAYPTAAFTAWTGGKSNLPAANWEVIVKGYNGSEFDVPMPSNNMPAARVPVSKKGYEAIVPLSSGSSIFAVQPYFRINVRVRPLSNPGVPAEVLRVRFVY